MSRLLIVLALVMFTWACLAAGGAAQAAESYPPQAPSSISWLPHGYGGTMWVPNSIWNRRKSYSGFRTVPMHTGSYGMPLWGWDVNGYYRGPQVPEKDPAVCQLPIGLIYPENGPALPPPRKIRKVHR